MRTLKVISGPGQGQTLEVEGEVVIGREDADLTLADAEVSRRHAVVRASEAGVEVEDLGSTNGTFVNEQRIEAPTPLTADGTIRVGTSRIAVELALPAVTAPRAIPERPPDVTAPRAIPERPPDVTAPRAIPERPPDVTAPRAIPSEQPPEVTARRPTPSPAPEPPPGPPAEERKRRRPLLIAAAVVGLILLAVLLVLLLG